MRAAYLLATRCNIDNNCRPRRFGYFDECQEFCFNVQAYGYGRQAAMCVSARTWRSSTRSLVYNRSAATGLQSVADASLQ